MAVYPCPTAGVGPGVDVDEDLVRVDPDAALIERLYLTGHLVHLPDALAEDSDVGRQASGVEAVGFAADPPVVLRAAKAAGDDDRPAGQLPQLFQGVQEAGLIFESAAAAAG